MGIFVKHCSIMYPICIACLIGSSPARAQSPEDTQKRSFAELLTRRTKASRAASARSIAAAAHTEKGRAGKTGSTRSTGVIPRNAPATSPLFATVVPFAASATGVSAATPVTPSGFGTGRDAFIESLYNQILARDPVQSELAYWSGVLAKGVSTEAVAHLIWRSREHRGLIRMGDAPGIPLSSAYNTALAASRSANQQ